jgi:hypothetical protein
MNPGLSTVIKPASGAGKLSVNLGTWAVANPVKEARRLQVAARRRYPDYHQLSIVATSYRGSRAARWTFWWEAASAVHPTEVIELLFTIQTWEGPQQYVLGASAPEPKINLAETVLAVAKQTFKAIPAS